MRTIPFFIHAMFRTGSTYIWNKFRQFPRYVCYYEPFHQLLGGITPANVQDTLTRNFKAAGHPELDRHYLYEYEALLRKGVPGIPFFKKGLSFDWFCQTGEEQNSDQKRYVDFLIKAAHGRMPLFQFNRTALRSAWFKSVYPDSLNIYLYRDPRDQWQSYTAIQARTGYDAFFIMDVIALSKNRDNVLIRPLGDALPLLKFHSAVYAEEESFYRILSQAYGERKKYFIFYYLWLVALLENALHADILWDINALDSDEAYRKKIQKWLVDRNIDPLDFSDCHITRYADFQLPASTMAEIEAQAQELIFGLYAEDQLKKIATMLPPAIGNLFPRQAGRKFPRITNTPAGEQRGEWLKTAENLIGCLIDDWPPKKKDVEDLHEELKSKDEQLLRFTDLLANESKKVEEKKREVEKLTGSLAEKDRSIGLMQHDLGKKRQEIEALIGSLAEKGGSIGLLQSDLGKKRQEIEALTVSLAEKEEAIGLLQSDLEKKRQKIEAMTGSLAEKEKSLGLLQSDMGMKRQENETLTDALTEISESNALLQAKLNILMRGFSFRIGRSISLPLRLGKKLLLRLRGFYLLKNSPGVVGGGLVAAGSYEKKIAVAEQIHLDFGRHRSGLKYGLHFLLGLHHPQGVVLDAFIERTFSWQPQRSHFYCSPWIGFIHVPPRIPVWFQPQTSNTAIFKSAPWQKSLPWCRGLFAFSKYHQQYLSKLVPFPVETLRLPSEVPHLIWSWEAFAANPQKKLVQVGWWLRKLYAIYQFPQTSFQKVFLHVGHPSLPDLMDKEREILVSQDAFHDVDVDSVTTIPFLTNGEYDRLLSRNIVFMQLYDSSACNAIVECIVRQTPLLINPLEAVVEYLGEEYPFYFRTLPEAADKLMNRDLIYQTHEYLRRLPQQQELSGEGFLRAFLGSGIYQSLPVPPSR